MARQVFQKNLEFGVIARTPIPSKANNDKYKGPVVGKNYKLEKVRQGWCHGEQEKQVQTGHIGRNQAVQVFGGKVKMPLDPKTTESM